MKIPIRPTSDLHLPSLDARAASAATHIVTINSHIRTKTTVKSCKCRCPTCRNWPSHRRQKARQNRCRGRPISVHMRPLALCTPFSTLQHVARTRVAKFRNFSKFRETKFRETKFRERVSHAHVAARLRCTVCPQTAWQSQGCATIGNGHGTERRPSAAIVRPGKV